MLKNLKTTTLKIRLPCSTMQIDVLDFMHSPVMTASRVSTLQFQ